MSTLPSNTTFQVGKSLYRSGDFEKLVTETEAPGGFRQATWSVCGGVVPTLTDIVKVHNTTYDKYPFIGRVSAIHKSGLTYDVTATRSSRDMTYGKNTVANDANHPGGETSERIYPAGTRLYIIMTDALSITPDIGDGGIVDPGLQLIAPSNDVGGYTAEQVWEYVSGLVGALDTPLLWFVRGFAGQQVVVIEYQDLAARYYVEVPEDQIDETYDVDYMYNQGVLAYGKGQVATSGPLIDHTVLKNTIRTKYENAQNTITRITEAQFLADSYVARFNKLRSSNDRVTLKCDNQKVRAVYPIYTMPVDDWPLELIEAGRGLKLKNRPVSLAPYNPDLKYITSTSYDWDAGVLNLSCGELRSMQSKTERIIDYNVNRLFNGPYNGPVNHPLADADLIPKVGPEVDASSPPNTSYGIPGFRQAQTGEESLPHGKAIDPNLIADEGLEANFNFIPTTLGFQGGIRVVPGQFNEYEIIFGNSAGKVVVTTCKVEVYKDAQPSPVFLFRMDSSLGQTAPITPPVLLGRKDFLLIKVTATASGATWAAVSLHAKKKYPGLK